MQKEHLALAALCSTGVQTDRHTHIRQVHDTVDARTPSDLQCTQPWMLHSCTDTAEPFHVRRASSLRLQGLPRLAVFEIGGDTARWHSCCNAVDGLKCLLKVRLPFCISCTLTAPASLQAPQASRHLKIVFNKGACMQCEESMPLLSDTTETAAKF